MRKLLTLLLCVMPAAPQLAAQDLAEPMVWPEAAPPTYPDTPEGLEFLFHDIFAAIKANDLPRISSYLTQLAIPSDSEWFSKTFGPTEAPPA